MANGHEIKASDSMKKINRFITHQRIGAPAPKKRKRL
jgi:hypothetical protein